MVIDHIGLAFFPNALIFRAIGRLAFPLFAWLIANGAYHTNNINKYLKRLFIFALISQIPYTLFLRSLGISEFALNIFFTLFVGLLLIAVYKSTKNKIYIALSMLVLLTLSQLLQLDYQIVGVLSIFYFYIFFNHFPKMLISQAIFFIGLNSLIYYSQALETQGIPDLLLVQPVTLLSLIFIKQYNGQKGISSLKYFFYWFYPVHLLIIYLLKLI